MVGIIILIFVLIIIIVGISFVTSHLTHNSNNSYSRSEMNETLEEEQFRLNDGINTNIISNQNNFVDCINIFQF